MLHDEFKSRHGTFKPILILVNNTLKNNDSARFLHFMVLFFKVLLNNSSKRQFLVLHCHILILFFVKKCWRIFISKKLISNEFCIWKFLSEFFILLKSRDPTNIISKNTSQFTSCSKYKGIILVLWYSIPKKILWLSF